eukprot:TRINITY_DN4270_c0_g2_i2.p1 TRINITY_DN4270_c0_g2~~TRINITY_DN4270_c0_g2_i2.p1  ORF type:complete len:856 (-),score=189.85 TRINITY_DN4270_c0_g2_i2:115-2682(-)
MGWSSPSSDGQPPSGSSPITYSLFGLSLLLFAALKVGFPRDQLTLERPRVLAWELWRPLTAIFLFNKNGMITVVNASLMALHSKYLEAEYTSLRYFQILVCGATGITVFGWWLEITHLGDAMAFFVLTLWCTRFSEDHVEEFKGLPIPPWSLPWMFIAIFTAVGHLAWEEVTGAAVAYALELWRRKEQALNSPNVTCRFGIGLSVFILSRAPSKAHLLGVPNYILHWVGRHLWPTHSKLLDYLLLFAEAFDIFVICLADLLGPDQLLWQRVLSAFSLSACFGLKASYPLLVVLAIQIGVVEHPEGPVYKILVLLAALAMVQERINCSRLKELSKLDLDGDGLVSEQDLQHVYGEEVAAKLIEMVDVDGDRRLSEQEIMGVYTTPHAHTLGQELVYRESLTPTDGPMRTKHLEDPAPESSLQTLLTDEEEEGWGELDISDADWHTEGMLLEAASPRERSPARLEVEGRPRATQAMGEVLYSPRAVQPLEDARLYSTPRHIAAPQQEEPLASQDRPSSEELSPPAQRFDSADDLSALGLSSSLSAERVPASLEVDTAAPEQPLVISNPLAILPVSHVLGVLVVAVPLLVLSPVLVPATYIILGAVVPVCVLGAAIVTPGLLWGSMALYCAGAACCLSVVLAVDVLYFFPFAYLVICVTALFWIPVLAVLLICCIPAMLIGAGVLLGVAILCTLALLPLFFCVATWLLGRSLLRTSLRVQHAFVTAPAVVIAGAIIILVHRALLFAVFALGVGSNAALRITDCTVDVVLRRTSTRMREVYTTRKQAAVTSYGGGLVAPEDGSWKIWVSHMTPTVLCDPTQLTTLLSRDDLCTLTKLKHMTQIPTQPFQGILLQGLNVA